MHEKHSADRARSASSVVRGKRGRPRKHHLPRLRLIEPDRCIECSGVDNGEGYPQIHHRGRKVLAHRWMWELHHGPIPPTHQLHHKCGNKRCVNTAHLQLVTPAEHVRLDGRFDKMIAASRQYREQRAQQRAQAQASEADLVQAFLKERGATVVSAGKRGIKPKPAAKRALHPESWTRRRAVWRKHQEQGTSHRHQEARQRVRVKVLENV